MTVKNTAKKTIEASKSFQHALLWTFFWMGVSLVVALGIWLFMTNGKEHSLAFLAGYLIEESLSVDNLFIFLMLFGYFKVPLAAQHRVLNYGIIGVIVLRGLMIFVGIELVNQFEFLMYIFGGIIIFSAFTLFFGKGKEFNAEKSVIVKMIRKFFTISNDFHEDKFFFRRHGKLIATPLFVALVVVEFTDFLFALDSIPAIFAVTREPLIIYSSNILAVLGLRSMYFLLEKMHSAFRFVQKGVAVILWFVGAKMVAPLFWHGFDLNIIYSLAIIIGILLVSILASLLIPERKDPLSKAQH